MHMTVEQALSVYPLTEARLVAGAAGKNRIVKSVNIMDAPDITDWIKEGEMIFTTAYLFRDRPDEAAELLRQLDRRGSAGLGIKLGRFWDAFPEEMIATADDLGFPLIELPYPFTFSDQMNALFREELRRSTIELQTVLDKQVRLMRFALQSGHIRQLFESVMEVIGCPIAVIGSRGQVVFNGTNRADSELVELWPWKPVARRVRTAAGQAFRVPLMKQSQCTGFALFFYPGPMLSPIEENLYLQAAELIGFHKDFKIEDFVEWTVRRDVGLLVKRHLKHGLSLEKLMENLDRWEIDLLGRPYRCVLTDIPGPAIASMRAERLQQLKREMQHHAGLEPYDGVHVVLEEGLLSVFRDNPENGDGRLETALADCLAGWPTSQGKPRACCSTRKQHAAELRAAFEECLEAQRTADTWEIAAPVVCYETIDLAVLFEQVDANRMRAFCSRMLGGLKSKDAEYTAEMLRTLETYLECDGQLGETAKRLYIHRNTAAYRIEKLSEMLDVDFKKTDDLLRLKLAFLFRRRLGLGDRRTAGTGAQR
ncbi:MAG: PucR family transcriptional regulator [Thermobacillus sp. ZCTH02-B1]|uniref:PucR family transcriptional regulator n=1 Tax=Thermobacillus sp. ZCTH02-B1 TaxID=1858795 RepID=UPI000B57A270|nr:PucR family transcriptional regulator [Thermobacillus sp. ZCTH02-B1]OUM96587.1 MAG: PucR family transcriptional regulator [Thermobacillus sp. ZCTH02-B1]